MGIIRDINVIVKQASLEKGARIPIILPRIYKRKKMPGTLDRILKDLFETYTLEDTVKYNPGAKNDPYYHNILVGGANAAGKGFFGLSYLPFGAAAKGSPSLFRHNQKNEIRKEIDDAIAKGLHPRVIGHSWGGATVANIAKDYPNVPFVALDPTSWFNRIEEIPRNLTIYRPDDSSGKTPFSISSIGATLAQILGGQWPKIEKGDGKTIEYKGGHVAGLDGAVNKLIWDEWVKRDPKVKLDQKRRNNLFANKYRPDINYPIPALHQVERNDPSGE